MKRFEVAIYGEAMIHRLVAFTDAVMSIIATVMVLEIPLPLALGKGKYDYDRTISALIIFLVSFLVVVSFYFGLTKFFKEIKKMTGWQIFAYIFFLFGVSLFPFMTQVNTMENNYLTLVIYILYIFALSRLEDLVKNRTLLFNGLEKKENHFRLRLDTLAIFVLALLVGFLSHSNFASVLLIYIPIRSLFRSVVIK